MIAKHKINENIQKGENSPKSVMNLCKKLFEHERYLFRRRSFLFFSRINQCSA